jgi:cell wall-associated NlpC family hydrolase
MPSWGVPPRRLALVLATASLTVTTVGTAVATRPSDSTSHPALHRPAGARAGSPRHQLIAVSVANVWAGRHKARRVDAPSLRLPVQLGRWLHAMTLHQRSDLESRLATQVRYAERVVVIRRQGPWSKIRIPDQTGIRYPNGIKGWIASRQLATQPTGWDGADSVATVTATKTTLHWTAFGLPQALRISYATSLPVLAAASDRTTVQLPGAAGTGWLASSAVAVHPVGTPAVAPTATAVVTEAKRFLGLPYLWAGTSAWGFDCSGLTEAVYGELGIVLPRDAADQSTVGKPVSRRALKPGDLVFFSYHPARKAIHHVAIYLGHGRVINAPFTGEPVKVMSLRHSYLSREYWGATRPLA